MRVKPSKGSSITGMIAGIVFIGIGIFVVIPNLGAFGVLWTLVALIITGTHAYNSFSDKGIASYEISIDEQNNYDEQLRKLKKLHDDNLITDEEFQQKQQDILNKEW